MTDNAIESVVRRAMVSSTVLFLLLGAIALVIDFNHQSPHFSTGGAFGRAASSAPSATGPLVAPTSTTVASAGASGVASTATTATTTPPSASGSTTPHASAPAPSSATTPTTPSGASQDTAGLVPAADGTYTYSVQGTEGATGFGSRSFPSTMTITVHGATGVDPQSERVFDLQFSSNHIEREIAHWGPSGVAWTYEAGQVAFGLFSQVNQGTYSPPMLQIPADLTPGTTESGTTSALNAKGAVERVETWQDTVVGPATVTVAGQALTAVKIRVTRATTADAAQPTTRTTTFWYSPALHMIVQFQENLTGSQTLLGIKFSYTEHLADATLTSFQPG